MRPDLAGMAGDAGDRAHGERVVAAEDDGKTPLPHNGVGFARQKARPGGNFGEMAGLALRRAGMDEGVGQRQIAAVDDVLAELFQRSHDARGAQHRRTHGAAGDAGPCFDGDAEDADRLAARLPEIPISLVAFSHLAHAPSLPDPLCLRT